MEKSIIMADNNLEFSAAVSNILRSKNFKVKTIPNGVLAAYSLNEIIGKMGKLPSVLIVDLSMPELDGLDLLSIIAKEGNLCTVVAVSSHFEYFDLKSFLRTPLVGVLKKTEPENFVEELLRLTDINSTKSSFNESTSAIDELLRDSHMDENQFN
jgi:CheY-like chemotaxis protein